MTDQQFTVKRIFLKDVSFELPMGVQTFAQQINPDMNVDLSSRNQTVDDAHKQVNLRVTVTAKIKEQTAFVAEVEYAGVFHCQHIPQSDLARLMGTMCLTILFPYVRETLDSIITKANLPALMLAPINFEALYNDAQEIEQAKTSGQNAH